MSLVKKLKSSKWIDALQELKKLAQFDTRSRDNSIACCALGDFYSGIGSYGTENLSYVNLRKAFEYYVKAVEYPFPEMDKAYYMIGFIAYYHPDLVTEKFLPKMMTVRYNELNEYLVDDDMDSVEDDPILIQNRKLEGNNPTKANIPLSLLHLLFSANSNYTSALASFGYKIINGHFTPASCQTALQYYRIAAHKIVTTQKPNRPHIKLSTENVRLDEEYNNARSTITDEEDVVQYYRYSADTGNVESQIAMGVILLQGDIGGLVRDYDRAFHYFKVAAEAGNPSALSHLAYMYQMGYGTTPNNNTARVLYNTAAKLNSSNAQTQLGVIYYHGWGVEKDLEQAKLFFEKAALEKRDPEALLYLGHMAYTGTGLPKSQSRARQLFINSAASGNLAAHYNLGVLSSNGIGDIEISCPEAIEHFRKILELTILKTTSTLAYKFYAKGQYDKALIHYELAADQGDVLGQLNAAWLYENGMGVSTLGGQDKNSKSTSSKDKIDYKQRSLEFYLKAAQQGSAEAHLKVGDYYYYGWSVPSNPERAAAYYQEAAALRNAQAMFNLGWMYQYGIGAQKDPYLAKRYYDLAVEVDPDDAYVPCLFALLTLNFDQFMESEIDLGYAWDDILIAFVIFLIVFSILIRQVVLLG
jgi:SEL1 protein